MSTHYSLALQPVLLLARADIWAKELIGKCKKGRAKQKKIPILCYSGMSGVAAATALALALHTLNPKFKFHMAYVRKKHEDSHGNSVEHDLEHQTDTDWDESFLVFVDDFICSGDSRRYVVEKVYDKFRRHFPENRRLVARLVPTVSINYEPTDLTTHWWDESND